MEPPTPARSAERTRAVNEGSPVVPPRRMVALGRGVRVPYPEPASASATKIGKANARRDTRAELRVRSELHRRGLRFRVDYPVRAGSVAVRPDVVFTRRQIAVFIDGCFWHGCSEHQHVPNRNRAYWVPKLAANGERDRRVDNALSTAGWIVVRVWEHEAADRAADRIEDLIREQPEDQAAGS